MNFGVFYFCRKFPYLFFNYGAKSQTLLVLSIENQTDSQKTKWGRILHKG